MSKTRKPRAKPESASQPPKVARPFQTSAMALESEEPPAASRWLLFALTGFVLAGVVWASLAEIDEIVAARGQLISSVPTIVVQPLELSVIKSIEVKTGDVVKEGQILAELDPTFTEADVTQLTDKLDALKARQSRLEAELANEDYELPADPVPAERLEATLFEQRKQTLTERILGFEQELGQIQASIEASRIDVLSAKASIAILQQIVDTRQTLSDRALGSKLDLLNAQAQLLAARRDAQRSESAIASLSHQAESTTAQRNAFVEEWRAQASENLIAVKQERASTQEALNKAQRRQSMTSLRAPSDAIVLDIAKRSTGSVVQGAETLFTLVPVDAPLQVEVRLSPNDIGHIRTGEDVRVKLDAFPFQKHGTLAGTIETISADTFTPNTDSRAQDTAADTAKSYYKAVVRLTETELPSPPPDFRLLPGMTVTADIDVGMRTVMSYLLYPILSSIDTSIREP